jgi:hypothetical protein
VAEDVQTRLQSDAGLEYVTIAFIGGRIVEAYRTEFELAEIDAVKVHQQLTLAQLRVRSAILCSVSRIFATRFCFR